ncbi:hypothetical protein BDQ17DRAFT_1253700, partial [Cyathus striatus]
KPIGLEAYLVPKVIRPVFDDKFAAVWEEMGTQIYKHLDDANVNWTTIDVVRFAEPVKYNTVRETVGPIFLWIGVHPGSLSRELAEKEAVACKEILLSFDIDSVEVAFRESRFRRYTRKLLDYVPINNLISSFCGPLTAALSLPIASVQTPDSESTGGIYLSAGNDIYLLTARHAVLPREDPSIVYDHRQSSQDTVQVKLPGPAAFDNMVQSISDKINTLKRTKASQEEIIKKLQTLEIGDKYVEEKLAIFVSDLMKSETAINMLEDFQSGVINDWSRGEDFIIGHVFYAPPIGVGEGPNYYTEDWALIELDRSKINWTTFKGNMMDLGPELTTFRFTSLMYPYKFTYPKYSHGRLFPILCIVPEDELTRPKPNDKSEPSSNRLIKNGGRTKTTIGCGNGIKSFVREQWNGTKHTSLEFAILSREIHTAFSDRGDSGSIIVDNEGRAAAFLIGGCGYEESADITYGTPFEWLLKRIKVQFPDVHLYQPSGKI